MALKQKTVTVKGKEYLLQHPGVRSVTRITDRVKNKHGIPQDEKMADEMLDHVVVNPRVKMDDFDDFAELSDLVAKAFAFITGQDDPDDDDQPS